MSEPELNFDNVISSHRGFYVTTPMSQTETDKAVQNARSKDIEVLKFFRSHPDAGFTPFEVWEQAQLQASPITSVRRAINTLTKAGVLVKTSETRKGEYEALNHIWRLK